LGKAKKKPKSKQLSIKDIFHFEKNSMIV